MVVARFRRLPHPRRVASPQESRAGANYDADFYRGQRDGSRSSAAAILPRLIDWFRPSSVVDVGCGVGTWLSEARRLGIEDVIGVDGDHVDRSLLEIPSDRFLPRNLDEPLNLGRRFDLVLCLEVAEHLPSLSADALVKSLTEAGPVVVFSAAIPGQGGNGHVNEAWPEAWARRFAEHGYAWSDPLRALYWNDPRVEAWYAQNLLVFHRADALAAVPWRQEPTTEWPLSLVHPTSFLRAVDRANRRPTLKRAWREFRRAIRAGFTGGAGG